jgi:hypothetical protein
MDRLWNFSRCTHPAKDEAAARFLKQTAALNIHRLGVDGSPLRRSSLLTMARQATGPLESQFSTDYFCGWVNLVAVFVDECPPELVEHTWLT